jgi:3-dehydroquinate synthetase
MPIISKAAAGIEFDGESIIQGMKKDKKRTGAKLALVMALDGFNMVRVDDLDEKEAVAAIDEFNR